MLQFRGEGSLARRCRGSPYGPQGLPGNFPPVSTAYAAALEDAAINHHILQVEWKEARSNASCKLEEGLATSIPDPLHD